MGYKISISKGSIIHFLAPILILLMEEYLILLSVSILYSTYQYLDYKSGEDADISQWNVIEFIAGIIFGLFLNYIFEIISNISLFW